MSELERYQNLKRECEVIGQAHDLLMTGRFPGGAAMTLATCQAYLKGLYGHMSEELKKIAPLEPKIDSKVPDMSNHPADPVSEPVSIDSKAELFNAQSTKA